MTLSITKRNLKEVSTEFLIALLCYRREKEESWIIPTLYVPKPCLCVWPCVYKIGKGYPSNFWESGKLNCYFPIPK